MILAPELWIILSLFLSHSWEIHLQAFGTTSSLTDRSIWLHFLKLNSTWFSPKKLLNLKYKMWSSEMPLYAYVQSLWKTSNHDREWVTSCCYKFLSALMTVLFITGDNTFFWWDSLYGVEVEVRGLSLQFQHLFLIVAWRAFWIKAWKHMTLGIYKEEKRASSKTTDIMW